MAAYFLACNSAKSNKTGNPFFTVSILAVNSYGRWAGNDYFVSERVFQRVQAANLIPGYPVSLSFSGDGKLTKVLPFDEVAPLELVPDDV